MTDPNAIADTLARNAIRARFGRDATIQGVAKVTAMEWLTTYGIGRKTLQALKRMLRAAGLEMAGQ